MQFFSEVKNEKLVYCAHSGETMKYSEYIFKFVYDKVCIPVDPFLVFPYYMATWVCARGDKKQNIADTTDLMLRCDELWVFGEDESDFIAKGGVRKEIKIWKSEKGEDAIKYFTWKEVGVLKYVPGSKWHNLDEE